MCVCLCVCVCVTYVCVTKQHARPEQNAGRVVEGQIIRALQFRWVGDPLVLHPFFCLLLLSIIVIVCFSWACTHLHTHIHTKRHTRVHHSYGFTLDYNPFSIQLFISIFSHFRLSSACGLLSAFVLLLKSRFERNGDIERIMRRVMRILN